MQDFSKAEGMPRWVFATLFVGFVLLYILAMPANHTESVDRNAYAMWAEKLPLSHLIDTRSILFTVLNRSLFVTAQALNAGLPATSLISTYSVLAGAGACVLLARLLNLHLSVPPFPAVLGGMLLGLSYGVWRYAMEVEVYVASIFLVLVALSFLLSRLAETPMRAARFVLPGIVSGLVVMFYQPNVFPLFLAIPALFSARDRFASFISYGIAGTLTVTFGYILAFAFSRSEPLSVDTLLAFVGSRNAEFNADPLNLNTLAKLVLSISHTLLSSNWVFGVDRLTEAFQARFPATETELKVQAAVHFRPWLYAPFALIPLLAGVAGRLVIYARGRSQRTDWRLISTFLAWFLIYALVAGRLDPGVSEVWIPIVPIFVVLGTVFVLAPAVRNGAGKTAIGFVACVGVWNWFGGIGMLKNPIGDFFAHQIVWLQDNATEKDLIVLTDSTWKFRTYLLHVLPTDVLAIAPGCRTGIAAEQQVLNNARKEIAANGGRVFVFQTFIEPAPRLAHVFACPFLRENAVALSASVNANIRKIDGEGAFSLYELIP